jgi:hypothetical protein
MRPCPPAGFTEPAISPQLSSRGVRPARNRWQPPAINLNRQSALLSREPMLGSRVTARTHPRWDFSAGVVAAAPPGAHPTARVDPSIFARSPPPRPSTNAVLDPESVLERQIAANMMPAGSLIRTSEGGSTAIARRAYWSMRRFGASASSSRPKTRTVVPRPTPVSKAPALVRPNTPQWMTERNRLLATGKSVSFMDQRGERRKPWTLIDA